MWISRAELQALKDRLTVLEGKAVDRTEFTVYKDLTDAERNAYSYAGYWPVPQTKIQVKTVIDAILVKIGMRLQYVAGQPEKVDVVGVEK